jgi:hypothetical protein
VPADFFEFIGKSWNSWPGSEAEAVGVENKTQWVIFGCRVPLAGRWLISF